ncbi:transcriptional regulator FtsR [Phycicoccus avicenniae]|uniref:transcriptional regulator FtsR n=1 Tax=Phycicoccus avicenniae TaxID=2828860 RepID=UPI002012206B|nr:MerR family transcriptional regulator [Phycicoccus avicenniae]
MAAALTIGAVVRALAEEFPDVSVSKVRFLESEGLVTPERSGAGYRRFTEDDVERLRYVLRAQRDLFWPLRVIKEALAQADRGLEPAGPDRPAALPRVIDDPALPDAGAVSGGAVLRLTRDELVAACGLTAPEVDELVDHGMLRPDRAGLHGAADVRAARAVAGLAPYGLELRHLRAFRTAADREVGLLEQATGALRGEAAVQAREDLVRHALALHAALVRNGLDEGT